MPLTALVLGGAMSLFEDEQAVLGMGVEPDLIIATNHAGRDRDGEVDAWVSFHAELFPHWIAARAAHLRPPAKTLWTGERRSLPPGMRIQRAANWGGSSGLLAVTVALMHFDAEKVILCGVPLTREGEHYDKPGAWTDAGNYRKGWVSRLPVMKERVRSMGGWTQGLLGAPDREWLHGA